MTPEELRARTKKFSLRVIRLVNALSAGRVGNTLGHQFLRSATSVAANYRAACRARTHPEFIAKIGLVEEEADETLFWIEMVSDAGLVKAGKVEGLLQEAKEILAIVTASRKTAKFARVGAGKNG
jgi:four helix bundle protein